MGCGASNDTKTKPGPRDLPEFAGPLFIRGRDEDYFAHAYQYATSSQPEGTLTPAAILYAAGDDDVIKAIEYAKKNKIAVATRSGGHQYLGFSSTCGDNIQIDMSRYIDYTYDDATGEMTCGVGLKLDDMNRNMEKQGLFMPHGECSNVHWGGHCQTGGYSVIARSFGLLVDYIVSFEIILAGDEKTPPKKKKITRDATDAADQELFWAVLGGSPGNFGILTHCTAKPLKDKDHPLSRGIKYAFLYSKSTLKELIQIMTEQADDDNVPGDYNVSVMVLGAQVFCTLFNDADEWMKKEHPELYGEDKEFYPVPGIAVVGSWTNLKGEGQEYDGTLFERIRNVSGLRLPVAGTFSDDKPRHISEMLGLWEWKSVREFPLPFHKRIWLSDSTNLSTNGFADWSADKVHDLEGDYFDGVKVAAQWMPVGGKASKFANPDEPGKTSATWRANATCFCALDAFYKPGWFGKPADNALEWAQGVQREAVGHENAKFCKTDRRLIWAPFGNHSLDEMHEFYFETEEKYQKLLKVKKAVDPKGVFSPNPFCVGFKDVDTKRGAKQAKTVDELVLEDSEKKKEKAIKADAKKSSNEPAK